MESSWVERTGYGLGDTASNFFWKTFEFFLLYFYTDVFGLSPGHVATLFLVTRIFDAVSDPVVGYFADRTRTRWGRFRPYLFWVPVPLGAAALAMFYTPDLEGTPKLVYAYVTYALVMLGYTAVNTPYGALMGVVSSRSDERTRFATYRFVLAFSGGIVVQYFTLDLVAYFGQTADGVDEARGFFLTIALYSSVAIALFWICFGTTRERVVPISRKQSSFRADLIDLSRNGPWMVLFLFGMLILSGAFIRNGAIVYYFKYYCGRGDLVPWFLTAGSLSAIFGMLVTGPVSDWMGKKNLLIFVNVANAIIFIAYFFFQPHQVGGMFTLHLIGSIAGGPVAVLLWTMYADTADYSEWKNHRRATGLIFSAATFSQKLGCSVGSALAGLSLGWFAYSPPVDGEPVAQSETTLWGLRVMMSFIPAGFALAAAGILMLYQIDAPLMQRIEQELAQRKREEDETSEPASQ